VELQAHQLEQENRRLRERAGILEEKIHQLKRVMQKKNMMSSVVEQRIADIVNVKNNNNNKGDKRPQEAQEAVAAVATVSERQYNSCSQGPTTLQWH
jgi:hypothetical protein